MDWDRNSIAEVSCDIRSDFGITLNSAPETHRSEPRPADSEVRNLVKLVVDYNQSHVGKVASGQWKDVKRANTNTIDIFVSVNLKHAIYSAER